MEGNLFEEGKGVARRCRLPAGQHLGDLLGFCFQVQHRVHFAGTKFHAVERGAALARFEPAKQRAGDRPEQARPAAHGHHIVARADHPLERIVMRVTPRQLRMNRPDQAVHLPGLQDGGQLLFPGELAHFPADVFRRDGLVQAALDGQGEPFGGARLYLETHACAVTQQAQQAHRLVGEAVNGKSAHLAAPEVSEAVRGVEQQAPRGGVQGDGDGVQRKVAAPQVLHDGGPADLGPGARAVIHVVARRGDAAIHVAGKDHLDVAESLVFPENPRPALLQLPGDPKGVALEDEVQVADGHPGDQVAHRAADQIEVGLCLRGEFLHARRRRALLGR